MDRVVLQDLLLKTTHIKWAHRAQTRVVPGSTALSTQDGPSTSFHAHGKPRTRLQQAHFANHLTESLNPFQCPEPLQTSQGREGLDLVGPPQPPPTLVSQDLRQRHKIKASASVFHLWSAQSRSGVPQEPLTWPGHSRTPLPSPPVQPAVCRITSVWEVELS